jgi:aerotaxis receptor
VHHLIPLDIEYTYKNNLIYEIDLNGIITYANSSFAEVTGFRKEELIGKNHKIFRHPDVPDAIYNNLWTIDKKMKAWFTTLKNIRRDGMYFWSNMHCTPKYDKDNNLIGFIIVHKPASKIDIEEEMAVYAKSH